MKILYAYIICLIFCEILNASEVRLIIWDPEYVCIYNDLIDEENYLNIIEGIINPMNDKHEEIFTKDALDSNILVKYSIMSKFVIYIGSEINDNKSLENNTELLKKYSHSNIFFVEYNTGYSNVTIDNSTTIQIANKDNHIYEVETALANGKWCLYGLLKHKCDLLNELIVKENKVNGYMREYEGKNIRKEIKYKNGIMVDTLKYFNNKGKLNGYEVRDSEGQKIYFNCGYHFDSENIAWCYDYVLNYQFTFFENGQISSMVRMKNGNKNGVYLEFDENSNITFRKTYKEINQ